MHNVTSAKAKHEALDAMRSKEVAISRNIDQMIQKGEITVDDDGAVQGCGGRFFCGMFGRRRARAAPTDQRARSGMDARVFGQKGKQSSATERLTHAAESVSAHVDSLSERAAQARARAKELHASGKRAEAMAALKRAKALDKQLETASATHVALERQVDVLAESALQREVASALSASVASTKKRTKGLLKQTDDAVDGATELKDFAEDIASTLGTLQTDTYDDDELLEELEAMAIADDVLVDAAEPAAKLAPTPAVATPAAIVVGVDPTAYPRAPSRAVERRGLLSDDGAAEAAAME